MFSTPPHKATPVPLPIFCIAFEHFPSRATAEENKGAAAGIRLYAGGGGGPNRSGVPNAVVIYDVDPATLSLTPAGEITFSNQDDACMSLELAHQEKRRYIAVGVNAPPELIQAGDNKNLRLFKFDESLSDNDPNTYTMVKSVQSVPGKKAEHYQRVARFSANGSMVITGTTDGHVHIWTFPALDEHRPPMLVSEEVFDVDIDSESSLLVVVTPSKCQVISIKNGKIVFEISQPKFHKRACEFRACRFGRGSTEDYLYLTLNEKSRRASFIGQWRMDDWKMIRKRQVATKPVTAFALSPDGERMAVGVSDLSVVVLSTHSMNVQARLSNAHSFPVTCIAFSPDSKVVASGSADSSIHLMALPKTSSIPSASAISLLMILLLILGLMLYIREAQEL
ncbi:hypothetical protein SeLEV6574_g00528 [Synchytrium endobioticum]|uniref:Uncharacterized protein n=1 Tax=Synchytrium endobioticum TaxID=286115 RepID=A0A507DH91_9FUNG|nr:hypothetical protein SeLEV6574_g00528 [Synchytrium endobioticum]